MQNYQKISGAEIAAVVRSATNFVVAANFDDDMRFKDENLVIDMDSFKKALGENKPAFGIEEKALNQSLTGGFHVFGPEVQKVVDHLDSFLDQIKNPHTNTRLLALCLTGDVATGKTALACHCALRAKFPFVKLISASDLVQYGEHMKCEKINKVFEDAYKSEYSVIIIDDIERLLGFSPVGLRFSTRMLEILQTRCRTAPLPPEKHRRLAVICTATPRVLRDLEIGDTFDRVLEVPLVSQPEEVKYVLKAMDCAISDESELEQISQCFMTDPIGIKKLQNIIYNAKQREPLTYEGFCESMSLFGLEPSFMTN